jgi:hypothetical protein
MRERKKRKMKITGGASWRQSNEKKNTKNTKKSVATNFFFHGIIPLVSHSSSSSCLG